MEAALIIKNKESEGTHFGKGGEGKYNGDIAVTEKAARIIKERGIRRYKWGRKVSITVIVL